MHIVSSAVCYPPLGQSTIIPSDCRTVKFVVTLSYSRALPDQSAQVALWHNLLSIEPSDVWKTSDFAPLSPTDELSTLTKSKHSPDHQLSFVLELPRPEEAPESFNFTFKYRLGKNDGWKWANETLSTTDGELLFQARSVSNVIGRFLAGYDSNLRIHVLSSETPETSLWSLSGSVEGANGRESTYTKLSLGIPQHYSRWFSVVRVSLPWIGPRHGTAPYGPSEGAIVSAFLRWDGIFFVLLAVSGIKDVLTEFVPGKDGTVLANSRNDRQQSGKAQVIAAAGKTFGSALAATMYYARRIVSGDDETALSPRALEIAKLTQQQDVDAQWYKNWFDGLGYCTWNGVGKDLTADKIKKALAQLDEHGIKISNLIIDDNWQSLDDQGRWLEFEANKEGFPHGLRGLTTEVREKFPNVKHIAVWHAILGYWDAISPHGKIHNKYKTRTVPRMWGGEFHVVDDPDIDRMYDDFYKFLVASGIDSVKTDDQCMLDDIREAPDRQRLIMAYQDAWIIACLRNFAARGISCMSQFPQAIFHNQLPTNRPRTLVRNSDDFFPDIPASHPWHIFTNAHNALFTSHLNTLPDWDMFQSDHEYASFHAAGRCISGGPVYITDTPGKHDVDLIKQMTAPDAVGNTIILRPSVLAKTVNQFYSFEEEVLLKVGGFVGGKGGTSILAIFNVSQRRLKELVHLNTFTGIEDNREYIVRAYRTGDFSSPLSLAHGLPIVSAEIDFKGWEILTACPVTTVSWIEDDRKVDNKIAVFGLLDKMTGAAAVLNSSAQAEGLNRVRIFITLKALGLLGIFVSRLKGKTIKKNFLILLQGMAIPPEYATIDEKRSTLKVDVEKAWEAIWSVNARPPFLSMDVRLQVIIQE